MKERKNLRNLVVALAFFVLWGNLVSLMLPADDYDVIVKLVDFASLLFALAVLAAWLTGRVKARTASSRSGKKADGADTDAAD